MQPHKKIICLAVDDEPPALVVLEQFISSIPALELAGTCRNAVEAMNFLRHGTIGLVFMDIQMPKLLGTDFIRALKNPPKVIFTTAYRKFAMEGFELNAVDYLLKPISFERFIMAVSRVMNVELESVGPVHRDATLTDPPLFLRSGGKIVKIPVEDILYIESLKDYVTIVTCSKSIVARQPISSLEQALSKRTFIRIHRSFIVALDKIESFNNEVVEINGKELPISRTYKLDVDRVMKVGRQPL